MQDEMNAHNTEAGQNTESEAQGIQQLREEILQKLQAGNTRETIVSELVSRGEDAYAAEEFVGNIEAELSAQQEHAAAAPAQPPAPGLIPKAVLGGLLAALVGGIIWGLIVHLTGYEVGYVAWALGGLCGFTVMLFTGKQTSLPVQVIAAASSLLGILLGKYFAYYSIVKELIAEEHGREIAGEISLFMPELFSAFLEEIHLMFEAMDIVFIILAVSTAWALASAKRGITI